MDDAGAVEDAESEDCGVDVESGCEAGGDDERGDAGWGEHHLRGIVSEFRKRRLKEETHAARWGLMRGYSVKATTWVDFVMTDSTRRESCHLLNVA